jgi:quinol monooxygenase YgiN
MTEMLKERLPSVTRTSDGCEFVHLYADPNDANHLILLERWESRAKYEKYREWAMAQSASSDAMSLLERDPVWAYLDDTGA